MALIGMPLGDNGGAGCGAGRGAAPRSPQRVLFGRRKAHCARPSQLARASGARSCWPLRFTQLPPHVALSTLTAPTGRDQKSYACGAMRSLVQPDVPGCMSKPARWR